MHGLLGLIGRFGRDERGVFAVIFGVIAIVVVALSGAVVDYVSMEQARSRSQIALDAATLALQPEIMTDNLTEGEIRSRAEALIRDRMNDPDIVITVDTIRMLPAEGSLFLSARLTVPTRFVGLVGVSSLSARVNSQAAKGFLNVEVSIALDITGSMGGTAISDLKEAVADLVDIIVKDDQEPYYSKVALAPYAQAVNAGTYADALRGPIRGPKDITSISWAEGDTKSIADATPATRRNNVQISSGNHGFNNGDWVYIWDVRGMTQINNRAYQVTGRTRDSFELSGTANGSYSNYSSRGSVVKCLVANCDVMVTSPNHGYANNDYLYVTDMRGMTALNNRAFRIGSVTTNTLVLLDSPVDSGAHFANTGRLHCTWQNNAEGCTYFRFTNTSGSERILPVTSCVTERAVNGTNDQPPTTNYVGRNYPAAGACPGASIIPLTSDRAALHDVIEDLTANGNTSGSLGILWSWYLLSPNFGYVWPDSAPAEYNEPHLFKAAIIMTDGEFNTVHCQGAVSRESSGGTERINCNAHNGTPYVQSRAYCDAMKNNTGIEVYTVGFNIRRGSNAANIMDYCASSPEHVHLAQNGDELRDAFRKIARNISLLRLTQ